MTGNHSNDLTRRLEPRRSLVVTGLLVLGIAAGIPSLAVADHSETVTIDGTVTGPNGTVPSDAVVLIGEDAMLAKHSPSELRAISEDDPQDLTVVSVGPAGNFSAAVDSRRAEAAVALSETAISDLRYLRGENQTLDVTLYERRPQTVHAHLGAVAADERRASLMLSLVNNDDTAVRTLSIDVASLPEGWSVATVETAGRYRSGERTVTWSSVPPGASAEATVVLAVPANASVGEYTVELRADSDTHRVDVESETVEILPEETPKPTKTVLPVEDQTPTADRTTAEGGKPTSPTDATGAGFGLLAAIVVLELAVALRIHRS